MSLLRSEMKTRREAKGEKLRRTEQARRAAYRLVDARDEGKCRACGRVTNAFVSPADPKYREHHHLRGRQVRDAESTGNICILCGGCHDLRHVKRTLVITGNADQPLTFELDGRVWNG